jgi:hypothetical protein
MPEDIPIAEQIRQAQERFVRALLAQQINPQNLPVSTYVQSSLTTPVIKAIKAFIATLDPDASDRLEALILEFTAQSATEIERHNAKPQLIVAGGRAN